MIVKNQYPICEFDTNKNPIIHPTNFLTENLPKKCVITYLRKELEHFCKENKLPIIGHLNSEVFDIPIYEYANDTDRLCITMALCGAPGAAVALEELYAMGCETFIVCGGAGALTNDSKVGEIIVPVSAVRDEGTSYHYTNVVSRKSCWLCKDFLICSKGQLCSEVISKSGLYNGQRND